MDEAKIINLLQRMKIGKVKFGAYQTELIAELKAIRQWPNGDIDFKSVGPLVELLANAVWSATESDRQ